MSKFITFPLLILLNLLLFAGCSKSDDQREFENQALVMPQGITETDSQGNITGQTDPDDWRIGPMYRGLIALNSELTYPPHPNPVPYNDNINIQIYFRGERPVEAIEILKFRSPSDSQYPQLRRLDENQLNSSFENITIEGKNIAEGPSEDARTTYRLLIYDGKQNLISYGDVRVQ